MLGVVFHNGLEQLNALRIMTSLDPSFGSEERDLRHTLVLWIRVDVVPTSTEELSLQRVQFRLFLRLKLVIVSLDVCHTGFLNSTPTLALLSCLATSILDYACVNQLLLSSQDNCVR